MQDHARRAGVIGPAEAQDRPLCSIFVQSYWRIQSPDPATDRGRLFSMCSHPSVRTRW